MARMVRDKVRDEKVRSSVEREITPARIRAQGHKAHKGRERESSGGIAGELFEDLSPFPLSFVRFVYFV